MIDDKLTRSSGKIELLLRIFPKFFAIDRRVRYTIYRKLTII